MSVEATPWVREVLTPVDRDAIASVLPADAALRLSADRAPGPRGQTFRAVVTRRGYSAAGRGSTPLSATLTAVHGVEARLEQAR